MSTTSLAERLSAYRKYTNLTKEPFAAALGIGAKTLLAAETGKHLSEKTVQLLEDALERYDIEPDTSPKGSPAERFKKRSVPPNEERQALNTILRNYIVLTREAVKSSLTRSPLHHRHQTLLKMIVGLYRTKGIVTKHQYLMFGVIQGVLLREGVIAVEDAVNHQYELAEFMQ